MSWTKTETHPPDNHCRRRRRIRPRHTHQRMPGIAPCSLNPPDNLRNFPYTSRLNRIPLLLTGILSRSIQTDKCCYSSHRQRQARDRNLHLIRSSRFRTKGSSRYRCCCCIRLDNSRQNRCSSLSLHPWDRYHSHCHRTPPGRTRRPIHGIVRYSSYRSDNRHPPHRNSRPHRTHQRKPCTARCSLCRSDSRRSLHRSIHPHRTRRQKRGIGPYFSSRPGT